MSKTLAELTAEIREVNVAKGWRATEGGPGENTWGDYIALLHSEVSEALEAYRDHRLADATSAQQWAPESAADMERGHTIPKPEGVGSELADVMIRLLDMCDVFGIKPFDMDTRLPDVAPVKIPDYVVSFGDHITWLHYNIARTVPDPKSILTEATLEFVLYALAAVAEAHGIDLNAEVTRKIAYNRTRSFQHGGRTLAEPTAPLPILAQLRNAIPNDPRDWWTGEVVETWGRLSLPRLTLSDANGDRLVLWTSDLKRAAEMLAVQVTEDDRGRCIELSKDEYSVCIVQHGEK